MDRRRYLSVAAVSLLARVAGCLDTVGDRQPEGNGGDAGGGTEPGSEGGPQSGAPTGDGPDTDASPGSASSETSDPVSDIRIALRNSTTEGVTVRLTVTSEGAVFFEDEVGVPSDSGRSVAPGIDETGRYEIEVAVEGGPDGSYPFSVERYDLVQGSNLIVLVEDDDVRIMIEE